MNDPSPSGEDTPVSTSSDAGPPWWKHRKPMTIAAILAAVAVAASSVVYLATRPEPEEVAAEYLSVLRHRDIDAALDYVTDVREFDEVSDDLLAKYAMADDWKVTNLARRHGDDSEVATVDFTITAADKTSRKGRFELQNVGGSWQILNPLAKVDLGKLPVGFAEFNGKVGYPKKPKHDGGKARSLTPNGKPSRPMWMFPGSYTAFKASKALLKPRISSFVAVPSKYVYEDEDTLVADPFVPVIDPGRKLDEEVNRQFGDWLGECARSSRIDPKSCPFSAGGSTTKGVASVEPDAEYVTDKVDWELVSAPKIELTQDEAAFAVREVEPGEVRLRGDGRPPYLRNALPVSFAADCTIETDSVSVTLAKPGVFAFEAKRPGSRCTKAYE